nr:uncharacterized protein LOC112288179 isoform X2 [Physcomitrium patens]|eukprot:XP_024387865.1 uncharacterized protein LOC112288179 isoform X2 [Physcomitrella patens]
MQIEEVMPEQRVEGFVRKFDVRDWRDPELNLYLTLTRATDGEPPEKEKKPWKDPYDDPFPLYRKEPVIRPATPPIINVQHQVVKVLSYKDPRPLKQMVRDTLRCFRDHPRHFSEMSEQEYEAMVELAAKHMTLTDCPAQEIVQLQLPRFARKSILN